MRPLSSMNYNISSVGALSKRESKVTEITKTRTLVNLTTVISV